MSVDINRSQVPLVQFNWWPAGPLSKGNLSEAQRLVTACPLVDGQARDLAYAAKLYEHVPLLVVHLSEIITLLTVLTTSSAVTNSQRKRGKYVPIPSYYIL